MQVKGELSLAMLETSGKVTTSKECALSLVHVRAMHLHEHSRIGLNGVPSRSL